MGGSWRSMHRQDTRTRQRRRPTDELVGERSYIPLQTVSEPLSGPREARDQKELWRRACGKKIPQQPREYSVPDQKGRRQTGAINGRQRILEVNG
ncbi:hypothetical protein FKM82_003472 [Ascaphus truei]